MSHLTSNELTPIAVGYPILRRAHGDFKKRVLYAMQFEGYEAVLYEFGRHGDEAIVRYCDYVGNEDTFDEAIMKSFAVPNPNRWPVAVRDPAPSSGWRWMLTPDGLVLLDDKGKIRLPNEIVSTGDARKILGVCRQAIHYSKKNHPARNRSVNIHHHYRTPGLAQNHYYLSHLLVKRPALLGRSRAAVMNKMTYL